MKTVILAGGTAMICALLPGAAMAQTNDVNAALRACQTEASSRLKVGRGNVDVERSDVDNNGNLIVRFRARRGNQGTQTGACAVSPSMRIERFRLDGDNNAGWGDNSQGNWGGRSNDNWGDRRGGWSSTDSQTGRGGWRGSGNQRQSDPWNQDANTPVVTNFHRVKVDTSGRGSFSGGTVGSAQLTRGWVDTKSSRVAVGVSGKDNFKVMFYGDIIQANDRRMVMRITDSDRGSASGRAEFELNKDRNEVQFINIQGRMGGQQFTSNFSR